METLGKETISSPYKVPDVPFRKSNSTAQNMTAPYHFSKPGVRAKDVFLHPGEWLKYRFTGDQLVGSVITLFNMYSTIELMRNGLDKKDTTRIYGGAAATALCIWYFLSARGARQPEGKNFTQRFIDTVKHPEQSMVQLAWLGSFPINALLTLGDLYHGYKGQQTGQNDFKKIGISRLTQGSTNLLGNALIFSSLFKNQTVGEKAQPVTWKHSNSAQQSIGQHIKEISRFAFHADKGGLLGRSLMVSAKLAKIYEALKSIQLERSGITDPAAQGGGKLLRSSLVALCLNISQAYYDYSRLYHDNKKPTPLR